MVLYPMRIVKGEGSWLKRWWETISAKEYINDRNWLPAVFDEPTDEEIL